METPFIKTEEEIIITERPKSKSLSKNKIERLLTSLANEYDFKMLMQNIHYLRLRKQFPNFNEFCEYVGFHK